jgi:hypothetical protein
MDTDSIAKLIDDFTELSKNAILKLDEIHQTLREISTNSLQDLLYRGDITDKLSSAANEWNKFHCQFQNVIKTESDITKKGLDKQQELIDRITKKISKSEPKPITILSSAPIPKAQSWADLMDDDDKNKRPILPPKSTKQRPFKFTENVSLDVFDINSINECHKHLGYLCYYKSTKKFYFSVNSLIIPAIFTEIKKETDVPINYAEYITKPGSEIPKDALEKFYFPREIYPNARESGDGRYNRTLTIRGKIHPVSEPASSNVRYPIPIPDVKTVNNDLPLLEENHFRLIRDWAGHYFIALLLAETEFKRRRDTKY